MPCEDMWQMEPCLRKAECEPQRNGGEWKCQFCGVEMLMMRVIRPEPEPTAEELAERQAQAERLAELMTDPEPERWPPDFSDLEGHPRPGAGVSDETIPALLAMEEVVEQVMTIGRTHGWDALEEAVEQMKAERASEERRRIAAALLGVPVPPPGGYNHPPSPTAGNNVGGAGCP